MNAAELIFILALSAPLLAVLAWLKRKISRIPREKDCVLKAGCKRDPSWFETRCHRWSSCRLGKPIVIPRFTE